jgi:hypothetical protein
MGQHVPPNKHKKKDSAYSIHQQSLLYYFYTQHKKTNLISVVGIYYISYSKPCGISLEIARDIFLKIFWEVLEIPITSQLHTEFLGAPLNI